MMKPPSSFALALALTFVTATATAQQQPSTFDRATARALAEEGIALLQEKDFAGAADRFARADALVHAPTFLVKLAEAQIGLGQLVSAQESYNRVLREELPPGAPPPFVKARAEAAKALSVLAPRIPYLTLRVAPASAAPAVRIDGVEVPAAALGVKRPVDPGARVVRVEAAGYVAFERTVTIVEGTTTPLAVELTPAQMEPANPPPSPPVKDAAVSANRPAPPPAVAAAPVAGTGSPRRTIGIVGMAVGGAGLALGAAAGGLAVSKHASLAKACPTKSCAGHDADIDDYHLVGTLATVGVIAGGAISAVGVVLFATAPKPARTGHLTPLVGPGWVGLEGRF